jgi:hypothetical protein
VKLRPWRFGRSARQGRERDPVNSAAPGAINAVLVEESRRMMAASATACATDFASTRRLGGATMRSVTWRTASSPKQTVRHPLDPPTTAQKTYTASEGTLCGAQGRPTLRR